MGDLRYCFEQNYVKTALERTKKNGLAVIDSDGVDRRIIEKALDRGVLIYDYINVGALEKERDYYSSFKDLRLAKYDGWPNEYWVDVTNQGWQDHILDLARKKKELGAIGIYFDNVDIMYMCKEGFVEEKTDMMTDIPSYLKVYDALGRMTRSIVASTGLVVMPNGGDMYVRAMDNDGCGYYIKTINQEGVLYEDFKKQSSSERKYRTKYVDYCRRKGRYIRGIEYVKNTAGIADCKAYYALHRWPGLYISKHKDLRGD